MSWLSVTRVSWLSFTSTNTTFFPKPLTTFLALLRGERQNWIGKIVCLNRISNSQPPCYESDMSHLDGLFELENWNNQLKEHKNPVSLNPCKMNVLTLSQTGPGFYMSALKVIKKSQWEKEKLLPMSNFSFSHSVFYPYIGAMTAVMGPQWLTLYQTTKF